SSATSFNVWSSSLTSTSVSQVWFRLYLYFTANPVNSHRVFSASAGGSSAAALFMQTNGQLKFNNTSGSAIFTTTAAIPLNQWFRLEGFVVGDASVGQVSLSLYDSADSTSPTETDTSTANQNTAGPVTDVRFGVGTAVANAGPYWMDDIGVSTTG